MRAKVELKVQMKVELKGVRGEERRERERGRHRKRVKVERDFEHAVKVGDKETRFAALKGEAIKV